MLKKTIRLGCPQPKVLGCLKSKSFLPWSQGEVGTSAIPGLWKGSAGGSEFAEEA